MVRFAKRPGPRDPALVEETRERVDHRGFQRLMRGERRQDRGQPARQHRLAGAGRAERFDDADAITLSRINLLRVFRERSNFFFYAILPLIIVIALGAMFAVYDRLPSAEQIARVGIEAGAEFNTATALLFRGFLRQILRGEGGSGQHGHAGHPSEESNHRVSIGGRSVARWPNSSGRRPGERGL